MNNLFLLIVGLLVAIAAGVEGFRQGWKTIKSVRQPARVDDAVIGWLDYPLNMWIEERVAGLFITLHTSAALCLLFLLASYLILYISSASWFAMLLALFCLAFSASLAGSLVAFPFARKAFRPVLVQYAPQGIYSGQAFVRWQALSHYQVEPDHHIIRIYSAKAPGIAVNAWQLKDDALWQAVLDTLQQHLPSSPNPQTLLAQKKGGCLVGWLLLIVILCTGIGIALLWAPGLLTPAYYPLAIFALLVSGTGLLKSYGLSASEPIPPSATNSTAGGM